MKNLSSQRWLPIDIETIRNSIKINMTYAAKSNIAYNLQYLQYISKKIQEDDLTIVLEKMLYKSYIITAMSIIETIFYYLLDEKGLIKKDYWYTEKTYTTNELGPDNNRTRIVNEFQVKKEKPKKQESLDRMLEKIKSKKVLGNKEFNYDILKYYRESRNKVHLYICESSDESDYNSFHIIDYVTINVVLLKILESDSVTFKDKRNYLDIIFPSAVSKFREELKKNK